MKIIDLHCDTIDMLLREKRGSELSKNDLTVDIQKLKEGKSLAQTFAMFVDMGEQDNAHDYCMKMYNKFIQEIEKNKESISLATNYNQIIENENKGKISALLSIEEGGVLQGNIENLNKFYDLGVRMMTLTWNYENEIGYPNAIEEFRNKGLKPFGIEVVKRMDELGMLIDVSHLSDGGFYDVAKYSKNPFIATHSNARKIANHPRNLTDDMIKIIANSGGVIGLNFFHMFLSNDYDAINKTSKIEDMIKHIKHITNIGGIDVMAIGTDFDGITSKVEVEDISKMNKLSNALLKEGFNEDEIDKILYKNVLRVIKEVL